MSERAEQLYDVIAVNVETNTERFIAQGKSANNAEAIARMAVFRRGVDEEFFDTKPHPYTLKEPRKKSA